MPPSRQEQYKTILVNNDTQLLKSLSNLLPPDVAVLVHQQKHAIYMILKLWHEHEQEAAYAFNDITFINKPFTTMKKNAKAAVKEESTISNTKAPTPQ